MLVKYKPDQTTIHFMMKKRIMKTATIYKEEISNPNIWKLLLIELGLQPETKEITITTVKGNQSNDNG